MHISLFKGEMDEAEDPSNLGKDNWDGMLHDEEEAPPSYEDSCTGEKFKHRGVDSFVDF